MLTNPVKRQKIKKGVFTKIYSYTITAVPPIETHTKQIIRFVLYFYLWDCFGIIVDFERPQLENPSHLNWINPQRDENGNWVKTKK